MSDHHNHGSATSPELHAVGDETPHFHNHAMLYLAIGGILMLGTGLTVALSYFDFGSQENNIKVAMALATVKASLVAAIFMHLREEKFTVVHFLLLTAVFVTGLFLLTLLAFKDHIHL